MRSRDFGRRAAALIGMLWAGGAAAATLITGALVHDGTGTPGRWAAVRIDGTRIIAVGI